MLYVSFVLSFFGLLCRIQHLMGCVWVLVSIGFVRVLLYTIRSSAINLNAWILITSPTNPIDPMIDTYSITLNPNPQITFNILFSIISHSHSHKHWLAMVVCKHTSLPSLAGTKKKSSQQTSSLHSCIVFPFFNIGYQSNIHTKIKQFVMLFLLLVAPMCNVVKFLFIWFSKSWFMLLRCGHLDYVVLPRHLRNMYIGPRSWAVSKSVKLWCNWASDQNNRISR